MCNLFRVCVICLVCVCNSFGVSCECNLFGMCVQCCCVSACVICEVCAVWFMCAFDLCARTILFCVCVCVQSRFECIFSACVFVRNLWLCVSFVLCVCVCV